VTTHEAALSPDEESSLTPPSGSTTEGNYEVSEAYTGLRNLILELTPDSLGLDAASDSQVIGMLMETGYPDAVVTLVAVWDGAASLYFSNGGGIIGAGEHESVALVSKALVACAGEYLSAASLTEEFPPPAKGNVRFYFVTKGGVYTAEADEDDLGNNRHSFSKLFYKGHELITAIREHSE
jgi:hypothetical protein